MLLTFYVSHELYYPALNGWLTQITNPSTIWNRSTVLFVPARPSEVDSNGVFGGVTHLSNSSASIISYGNIAQFDFSHFHLLWMHSWIQLVLSSLRVVATRYVRITFPRRWMQISRNWYIHSTWSHEDGGDLYQVLSMHIVWCFKCPTTWLTELCPWLLSRSWPTSARLALGPWLTALAPHNLTT